MKNTKVMLVDDDDNVRKVVERLVKKEGYDFCYAADGQAALELFAQEDPDIIILDVMLPEIDGFEVCQRIRKESTIPIILLSAKSDIVDKSVGYNMGADDYITKPFSPAEMSLRIKAILRRDILRREGEESPDNKDTIVVGDLIIDGKGFEVTVKGDKAELTSKEFELLWFMAKHPGQVFTREQLFDNLWEERYLEYTNTITVFVRKIREKIEPDPSRPEYILTVWGVGYKFCGPDHD